MTESKEGKRTWREWLKRFTPRVFNRTRAESDVSEIEQILGEHGYSAGRLSQLPDVVFCLLVAAENLKTAEGRLSERESHNVKLEGSLKACAEILSTFDSHYNYLIENDALEDTASAILDWGNKWHNEEKLLTSELKLSQDALEGIRDISSKLVICVEQQDRLIRKLERKNAVLESKASPKTKKKAATKTKRKGK